jgi:TonB family protein
VSVQEEPVVSQPVMAVEEVTAIEEVMTFIPASVDFVAETSSPFPWKVLMLLVYVGGILFFVLRHLWSLGRMVRLLRASRRETLKGGITLFVHREKAAPFSWMNMIAVSEEDLEENRNAILTHERAHIKNCHSWDLLLAEVCIFFQWFNPAAWLLKQELQTIHEYEADEWVINNGIDAKTYQLLIIKKAVGARLYSIANSFNHSSLKKRITMMIKKKSNPWARLKYLYVLPLATVAVAAFARPEVSNQLDEISCVKVNDLVSVVKTIGAESEDSFLIFNYDQTIPVVNDSIERLPIKLEAGKKPLFVIDGRPFGCSLSLDDIDASKVESATLLDRTEAVKLYGEKAKDGALVIISKNPEATKVIEGVKFTQCVEPSEKKFILNGQVMKYPDETPVPGASIIIRGTTDGTLADIDGNFQLPVKEGDVIIVSYVGLQTQQLHVQSFANLVVWMKADVQPLEEIVVVGYAPEEEKKQPIAKEEVKQTEEEVIFQVVEQMPEFPGGMSEAMKFLAKNIKYPVAAQQAKIEGRVIVQFVVGKDGSISDVHTVRSVSPELDAEAIRVVSMMPKWNPGKQRGKAVPVSYTMPIMFRLQGPTPKAKEEKPTDSHQISLKVDKGANLDQVYTLKDILKRRWAGSSLIVTNDINESPLVIVDGKEMGVGIDVMKEIPVDQIKTISVMKSEKDALAQYGDKAKDGVIMIVTKNNQQ